MKPLSHFRGVVLRDLAQLKSLAQPATRLKKLCGARGAVKSGGL